MGARDPPGNTLVLKRKRLARPIDADEKYLE
jgi:hypothetical protein